MGTMKETTAVYPGTFDPMTKGHFDLIRRSAGLFDRLIVAVAGLSPKPTRLFGIEERMAMVRECLEDDGLGNVEVLPLDCLLVEFCRRNGVRAVVRGLRAYRGGPLWREHGALCPAERGTSSAGVLRGAPRATHPGRGRWKHWRV